MKHTPTISIIFRFLMLATFLMSASDARSQQLELSSTSGPSGSGPLTASGAGTFLLNTGTSATFSNYTPAVTVSVSFDNQQFTSATTPGLTVGSTFTTSTSSAMGAAAIVQSMSIGAPASSEYTSDPFGTSGTNFDVANNFGFRLMTDTRYLNTANTGGTPMPANSRVYYGDLVLTFSSPVSNPVVHLSGMGGALAVGTSPVTGALGFYTELELSASSITAGCSLTGLSGTTYFNVNSNKILNSAPTPSTFPANSNPYSLQSSGNFGSGGSVRINTGGKPITSVRFEVYLRGDGGIGTLASPPWSGTTSRQGDAYQLSVSLGTVNISGNVFNDANGMSDNTVNGSAYTAAGLNAVLIDSATNLVVATTPVSSGAYSFSNQLMTAYKVMITTATATVGAAPPPAIDPTGFVNTGEVNCGTTANCTGSDGTADGILNLGVVSSSISQANFGITQAGYIYAHKKTIDENSSIDFSFSVSGGPTTVGSFQLNDNPSGYITLSDLGASQSGRLWAVGKNNTLYYRDLGSTTWIATSITDAKRVDGGAGNIAYVVNTSGLVISFDGTTSTSLSTSNTSYGSSNASDIGSAWDGNPYIVTAAGTLWRYNGSGTSWTQVNASTNNLFVDGNPVTGDAVVSKSNSNVVSITSGGTGTSLGRPSGANASANALDVAVDASGNIFAVYAGISAFNSSVGTYPYKYTGSGWSTDEFTARTGNGGLAVITGGVAQQAWMSYDLGNANYATIYTRTYDGTNIFWYDNEWLRTSGSNSNAAMIAVVPGSYTLTETLPSGWDLNGITIYDPTANSAGVVATQVSTLNVAAGEVVHVDYKNGLVQSLAINASCGLNYVQDFGSGTSAVGPALTGLTSYHYFTAAPFVQDGYYTLLKTSTGWGNASLSDHTGTTNGYFLVVNASYAADEFYRQRVSGLVPGLSYTMSFWAADLSPSAIVRPGITMGVADINTGATISSVNTGSITATSWQMYSFVFTATGSTADIFLRNNAEGGTGNDIAIDDIAFNLTPISTPITTVAHNTCAAAGSITVTSPVGAVYEYSMNGTTFQSSPTFSNLAPGTYTVTARYAGSSCIATKQDVVKLAICGNVYNDANGLTDNLVNSTGSSALPSTLYAVLYDNTTGKVADVVTVSGGVYSLNGVQGDNFSLYLTTTPAVIDQTAVPTVTLPSGWVNAGSQPGSGTASNTTPGILALGTVSANTSNANFGIEQLPTPTGVNIASQGNPGGTNAVNITSGFSGSDPDGIVSSITITTFPSNTTSLRVGTIAYYNGSLPGTCPSGFTCQLFPASGGLNIPTNSTGVPTSTVALDPIDGNVTPVVTFSATDNAGKVSSTTSSFNVPFAVVAVSGNVWNDADGNATKNGTEQNVSGNNISSGGSVTTGGNLYVNLMNAAGNVIATTQVAADGTYSFANVPSNTTGLKLQVSTTQGTVDAAQPATTMPGNWVTTGNSIGAGNTASQSGAGSGIINLTTANTAITAQSFGMEQLPTPTGVNIASQGNPGGTNAVNITSGFSGSDPDGIVSSITITTFPSNTTSLRVGTIAYYNGSLPGTCPSGFTCQLFPASGGLNIPTNSTGVPTSTVALDPVDGNVTPVVTFSATDNAGKVSSSTSSFNVPFAVVAVSGSVWNDADGNATKNGTEQNVSGNNTSSGGSVTTGGNLYVNLVNAAGNVIATTQVAADGTYSFANVPSNTTGLKLQVSTTQGTVDAAQPATTVPGNWVTTGNSIGAGNTASQSGAGSGIINLTTANTAITAQSFGIEQKSTADAKVASISAPSINQLVTLNGTGSNPPLPTGSDPEDQPVSGTLSGKTVAITSLPTNGQLWYSGVQITSTGNLPGSFNPSLLQFKATGSAYSSTSFQYAYVDAAGIAGNPATYTLNWSVPLPVKIVSFTGTEAPCQVMLRWEAEQEQGTTYIIEESANCVIFTTAATVEPQPGHSGVYSLALSVSSGRAYYRVVAQDASGVKWYSKTIVTNNSCSDQAVSITPNPSSGTITVKGLLGNETVSVFDIAGHRLLQAVLDKSEQLQINLAGYADGIYQVVVWRAGKVTYRQLINKRQ